MRTRGRCRNVGFRAKPIAEIARGLHVQHVVEAQIQRTSGRLKLNVRLIDAVAERLVWEASYDRFDAAPVFELRGEVATAVAEALEARLLPWEADRVRAMPTGNLAAWQLERDARLLTASVEENASAIRMLRCAIALDPTFAEADTHLGFRYRVWAAKEAHWADSTLAMIDRALALDPMEPRALRWKAGALAEQGHCAEARTVYQNVLALQKDPVTATAFCTMVENRTGRLADAAYWCHLPAVAPRHGRP